MFLFDAQSKEYKEEILPKNHVKMAVELGASMPWYKYADVVYGLDDFGASMPIKYIHETYGFTSDAITAKAKEEFNK
jgi:transketolase